MKRFDTIVDLRSYLLPLRGQNLSIGLVPTMGALHQGHVSLIEKSRNENDITICSIFVNPTQFNDPKDLEKYPRTLEGDLSLLKTNGVEIVFHPSVQEIYPHPAKTKLHFGEIENILEGAHRPGHFNGVGQVVSKLFNITQPDRAYFGQKDLQQVALIKQLVRDFSFPIQVITCPIIREENGLAMSSRNELLSDVNRAQAGFIHETLSKCAELVHQYSITDILETEKQNLISKGIELEYLDCVHSDTLDSLLEYTPCKTAFCIALKFGGVRLIDNVIV